MISNSSSQPASSITSSFLLLLSVMLWLTATYYLGFYWGFFWLKFLNNSSLSSVFTEFFFFSISFSDRENNYCSFFIVGDFDLTSLLLYPSSPFLLPFYYPVYYYLHEENSVKNYYYASSLLDVEVLLYFSGSISSSYATSSNPNSCIFGINIFNNLLLHFYYLDYSLLNIN